MDLTPNKARLDVYNTIMQFKDQNQGIVQTLFNLNIFEDEQNLIWTLKLIFTIPKCKIGWMDLLDIIPTIFFKARDDIKEFLHSLFIQYFVQRGLALDVTDIYLLGKLVENQILEGKIVNDILIPYFSEELCDFDKVNLAVLIMLFNDSINEVNLERSNNIISNSNQEITNFFMAYGTKFCLDYLINLQFDIFLENNIITQSEDIDWINSVDVNKNISPIYEALIPLKKFKYKAKLIHLACFCRNKRVIDELISIDEVMHSKDGNGHSIQDYLIISSNIDLINDYKLFFDKFAAVKYCIYSHQNDTLDLFINEEIIPLALYYSLKYCNLYSFFRFLKYKISIPKSYLTTSIDNCKLKNIGNTCYFNSLMHFLISSKMLKDILDIQNFTVSTNVALRTLKFIFDSLLKKETFIITTEFIKAFNIFAPDEIHKQNDASEALIKIMSKFPQQIKALYKFSLSDEETQKISFHSMLDLNLYDPNLHLLDELIDNDISFLYFPQYIIITLKRFRYDPLNGTEKIYQAVFPNLLLDLSKNSCYENVKAYYKRNSMIIHSGDAKRGHYYTFVANQCTDEVKKFNDEEINLMNKDYLLSEEVLKNIYLMIYVRIPEDEFLRYKDENEKELSSFKNMIFEDTSEINSSFGNDSYLGVEPIDVARDEDITTLEMNENFSQDSTFLDQDHMTQLQHQITNDNPNLSTQSILLDLSNILNNINAESVIDSLKDYIKGMLTIHENELINDEDFNDILYPCNKNEYFIIEMVGEYSARLFQFKAMPDDGIITIPETLTINCNEIRIIDAENDLFNDFKWKKVIINNLDIIKKNILKSLKSETLILIELKEIKLYGNQISNFDVIQKAETMTKDKNNILYYRKLLLFGPKNLKDVEINDITIVGKNSFSISSSNLRSIKFPDSVELIEKNAFANCANLCLICFSANSKMRKLKKRAFYSCCSLQEFAAPRDLVSIGKSCFEKCKLKIINLNPRLLKISSSAFSQNSLNNIMIPESVIEIRDDAFKSNNIIRVEMSNKCKITNIAATAFADNEILILDMPNRFKKLIVSSFSTHQFNLVPFSYNIHQKTMEKQKIINKISKIAVLNSEGVRYREQQNALYFTCSNKMCDFKIICYRKDTESDFYTCIQYNNHEINCHVSCPRPLKAHLDDVLKIFFQNVKLPILKLFYLIFRNCVVVV